MILSDLDLKYNEVITLLSQNNSKESFRNFVSSNFKLNHLFDFIAASENKKHKEEIVDLLLKMANDFNLISVMGGKFFENGYPRIAIRFYQAEFLQNPHDSSSLRRMGNALRVIGQIDDAVNAYRQALKLKYSSDLHSRMLLAMHYENSWTPEELADEHRKWQFPDKLNEKVHVKKSLNFKSKKLLKIVYVSPDFRSHPVAYFFQPIIHHHNRENFFIVCYSTKSGADGVTRRIKSHCSLWRDVEGMALNELMELISEDEIDILIDLAGHTSGNRLDVFRKKAAPIQITYLGYPNGTGIDEVDFRITDSVADPVGITEHLYSEKLIRLPSCFLTFEPPQNTPPVALPPFKKNGFITFGSFNKFSKISSSCIELWVEILNEVPNSRLFLKTGGLEDSTEKALAIDRFRRAGLRDTSRVQIHDLVPSRTDHLQLYDRIDIALDPFPYNGTTTTCQALWMGVPVVSLCGDRHVARVGASLLSQMGLQRLVASSFSEYCRIATTLANDQDELEKLRSGMRLLMKTSPLLNHQIFVENLEREFRKIWSEKCNQVSHTS